MPQANILVTRALPEAAIQRLRAAGCAVEVASHGEPLTSAQLVAAARGRDVLLVQMADRIDAAVLDAAGPRCRLVATAAAGYDNIDLAAARARGVIVANSGDVLAETTADLTWALMLAAARRLGEAERTLRAGRWTGWKFDQFLGVDVHGKTLGIVGLGRIGRAVARRAAGFAMRVIYSNRSPVPPERRGAAHPVALDELLTESDFVSLHLALAPETQHLIAAPQLARMKPTAVLVNTARGPIVDEPALAAALRDGRLAAAGLDVYEREPRIHPALRKLQNVVLLPHIGSATTETRQRMALAAADNILAVLEGRDPPHRVA